MRYKLKTIHVEKKVAIKSCCGWFRSIDLWVMSPTRFLCATQHFVPSTNCFIYIYLKSIFVHVLHVTCPYTGITYLSVNSYKLTRKKYQFVQTELLDWHLPSLTVTVSLFNTLVSIYMLFYLKKKSSRRAFQERERERDFPILVLFE